MYVWLNYNEQLMNSKYQIISSDEQVLSRCSLLNRLTMPIRSTGQPILIIFIMPEQHVKVFNRLQHHAGTAASINREINDKENCDNGDHGRHGHHHLLV